MKANFSKLKADLPSGVNKHAVEITSEQGGHHQNSLHQSGVGGMDVQPIKRRFSRMNSSQSLAVQQPDLKAAITNPEGIVTSDMMLTLLRKMPGKEFEVFVGKLWGQCARPQQAILAELVMANTSDSIANDTIDRLHEFKTAVETMVGGKKPECICPVGMGATAPGSKTGIAIIPSFYRG
jgi:hypothetical protein